MDCQPKKQSPADARHSERTAMTYVEVVSRLCRGFTNHTSESITAVKISSGQNQNRSADAKDG